MREGTARASLVCKMLLNVWYRLLVLILSDFSTSQAPSVYSRLKWILGCAHFGTSDLIRIGVCFGTEWRVNACECRIVVRRFANEGPVLWRLLICYK